jgi:hypothetical protein
VVKRLQLKGHDIGQPAHAGSTTAADSAGADWDLVGGGADIWETRDQFHFAAAQHEGDFDARVRVSALQATHAYTKAGIMVRAGLEADAAHFFHLVFPDNRERNRNSGGYEAQYRLTQTGGSTALYPAGGTAIPPQFPVQFPNAWLRLQRQGDRFLAGWSLDGQDWVEYASWTMKLPVKLWLGLAVTSHDDAQLCRASFRDFALT